MAINFRNIASEATVLSDIMQDRTKVDKADGVYCIVDFDIVSSGKEPYAICAISDKEFINGGFVLTKVFSNIVGAFNGDIGAAREEFRKSGGIRVKLTREKTRDAKHDITKVEVL